MDAPARLTIASRKSPLALWQAGYVRRRLAELYPQTQTAIVGITTSGDRNRAAPLHRIGGKGLFVKELELALEAGEADLAVHSMKDVPMSLPPGFELAIVGEREDPRDCLVCNHYPALEVLPHGAIVGTSSLRRESQLRARLPHLDVRALRGNVETRLKKLDEGQYAAIILAAAGLRRLGLAHRIRAFLSPAESMPAAGQGALGIEYRAERCALGALLRPLTDAATTACVGAERALSRALAGSCDVPVGGHAYLAGSRLRLEGVVAARDGSRVVHAQICGECSEAERLGEELGRTLLEMGGREALNPTSATLP
jgi:hydroxymethylbilane synthase